MTAAQQWIDSARALTQPSSVPLGVPITRHMDMVLRDTQRDLRSALDALDAVLALHQPEAFHDDPSSSFCARCQRTAGIWPCETVDTIESMVGGEQA